MKKITIKLIREFSQGFLSVAKQMEKEGQPRYEIESALKKHIERETFKFYRKLKEPESLGKALIKAVDYKADSKIEIIYCQLFQQNSISFQFQYKIGPYRADFLIGDNLVFEIDGPMHDKKYDARRDKYMENLGYKVFRVPVWLAAVSYRSVLAEIQEIVGDK